MAFNNNITPGSPPLLWSDVHEAFIKINENFDILSASVGGGTLVNFETLDTSVSPASDNTYNLGSETNKWGSVFTSNWSTTPGDDLNGVWLGTAHIKGISGIVELPAGSMVDGDLIIDPDKTFFKSVQVDNGNQVVANSFSDTLNLNSGTAINLVVDSAAESITVNNTGVTSLTAGTAISISGATGGITVNNTGVTSLTAGTAISGRAAGAGISVSASTGGVTLTNTGLLGVQAGFGITISNDSASGISQISFNPTAAPQTGFTTIAVPGQTSIASDTTSDTLNITAGYGLTITTTESTDTLLFSLNQRHDLIGSVFGDDSSLLVDAVSGYIYGNVSATTLRTAETRITLGGGAGETSQGNLAVAIGDSAGNASQGSAGIAIGYYAGKTSQEAGGIAIGYTAAQITQGESAVSIGWSAGQTNQGDYAIAIGYRAGFTNQNASSIVLNASGAALEAAAAGFFVNPVRSTANGRPLMYNTVTSELVYSSVLEFVGSTISTSDSSGLTVDVLTTFNTDVIVENDLTVAERLTVKGSRVINIAELKSVVAASSSFSDFQTKIAALV